MFHKARKELHKHLKKYTFSLVTRAVTIPSDCVLDNGEVSHYYTTSDELPVSSTGRKGGSVWIKKKSRHTYHHLGPVMITSTQELPKVGDVVFGEMYQVANSERKFGKQSVKTERQSYKWWTSGAPLYYLATMVLKGTSETEESLRKLLKLPEDYDDLWMLARVVLFNNVQCFVDMFKLGAQCNIKLREKPVQFVQQLSTWLDDLSVFTEFQKLLPDTVPVPVSMKELRPLSACQPLPTKNFVGRKRRHTFLDEKVEEYNPDESDYQQFSHRQPAGATSASGPTGWQTAFKQSPTFVSHSPTYAPETPPYVPCSPPYAPVTPTHE